MRHGDISPIFFDGSALSQDAGSYLYEIRPAIIGHARLTTDLHLTNLMNEKQVGHQPLSVWLV